MVIQEIVFLFISFIIFYFLYRAYEYLSDLESCACAPTTSVKNLQHIEMIYLVIIACGILFKLLFLLTNLDLYKILEKNMHPTISILVIAYVVVMFGIFFWYVYNIFEYNKALQASCACTNAWQNHILYIHALYMAAPILLTLIGLLNKFKVNTSLFVLIMIFVFIVYLYENFIVKTGRDKEAMSNMLLGNYEDAMGVYDPTKYSSESTIDESLNKTTTETPIQKYLPQIAQPNQKYKQIRPDEYPQDTSVRIQAPLSSHENIVRKMRYGK